MNWRPDSALSHEKLTVFTGNSLPHVDRSELAYTVLSIDRTTSTIGDCRLLAYAMGYIYNDAIAISRYLKDCGSLHGAHSIGHWEDELRKGKYQSIPVTNELHMQEDWRDSETMTRCHNATAKQSINARRGSRCRIDATSCEDDCVVEWTERHDVTVSRRGFWLVRLMAALLWLYLRHVTTRQVLLSSFQMQPRLKARPDFADCRVNVFQFHLGWCRFWLATKWIFIVTSCASARAVCLSLSMCMQPCMSAIRCAILTTDCVWPSRETMYFAHDVYFWKQNSRWGRLKIFWRLWVNIRAVRVQ